jgi:hypothetical protein
MVAEGCGPRCDPTLKALPVRRPDIVRAICSSRTVSAMVLRVKPGVFSVCSMDV